MVCLRVQFGKRTCKPVRFLLRRSELHESVGRVEFERLTDFWTVITISCTLLRISCTKIDHSESRNISKTALINPRKSEIGKISKQILDRINTNGRACDLETCFNIQEKNLSILLYQIFRISWQHLAEQRFQSRPKTQ